MIRSSRGVAIGVVLALAAGCAPPFSIRRDAQAARRLALGNVLTTGDLSRRTNNLLYDRDLVERYAKDPAGTFAVLHGDFVAGRLRPEAAASIAEVAYHHGQHGGGSPYYLAAALYAWTYLFPQDPKDAPDRFNPRVRAACDLYNRGVTEGLKKSPTNVSLDGGTYALPFGTLDVTADPAMYQWSGHRLTNFYPVAELVVTGFATYYRWPGLGAPLAASIVPEEGRDTDLLARRARVPVTAILRPSDLSRALRDGEVRASIELYPGYGDQTVKVGKTEVPLEAEPTASFALALSETRIWEQETSLLRGVGVIGERQRLISSRPYQRGLIPVVFVHGTDSSLARWMELYNELDNDPRIHDRFQFWFFSYSSGNPIIYSASLLRDSLQKAVATLDPEGRDPALRRMVVIGHSQGGLLTKAMVVDPGDAFWRNVSRKPFDEVKLSSDTREFLRPIMFFHPLPFVTRVVFISTPHHGSYVAGSWIAHQAARLIRAPLQITRVATEVLTADREALAVEGIRGAPTAVDNMTPGNPFVKTLASLPTAPGVTAHSIISVDEPGPPQGKNDGVVEYDSAHIEGVESEVVVLSSHSCQSNPHTIQEVRRILLEHAGLP